MKKLFSPLVVLALFQFPPRHYSHTRVEPPPVSQNLIIITLDGMRWQEIFHGADEALIGNEKFTSDTSLTRLRYWSDDPEERRKKLLPFLWNVVAVKGQIWGNRDYHNNVNVANNYSISYPGYNEIFSGDTDPSISSNEKVLNEKENVLGYLNSLPSFREQVAVFSSWDVFPCILNAGKNDLFINSGYSPLPEAAPSPVAPLLNKVQETIAEKGETRQDMLTFIAAREYLRKHHPRILYLALGETDEAAHQGKYDAYLAKATEADQMIAELWSLVQSTPGYHNNTTFIITTDHGRGAYRWTAHGPFIRGSSQTWMAIMGPSVKSKGEQKSRNQLYQQQLAPTIARVVGEEFKPAEAFAPAIPLQ